MQPKRLLATATAAAISWVGSSAFAAPITSFSSVPVTDSGAITDDAGLTGTIQNLMTVDTGSNDWTNSSIRITLTSGSVYNATNPAGTESTPNAGFWTFAGARNGPFDTFVNSKGTGATPNTNPQAASILGTLNADGSPGPTPAQGLSTSGATLVSVQWGNTTLGETGAFSVGRFTLSPTATGTFFGQTFDSASGGVGTSFSGTITGGVMTLVPEPGSLGLLGLAAAGLLRRRRTA